jgi:hypothetical protein
VSDVATVSLRIVRMRAQTVIKEVEVIREVPGMST